MSQAQWGYAALLVPESAFYQGFFIPDPKMNDQSVTLLMFEVMALAAAPGMSPIGVLQGILAELAAPKPDDVFYSATATSQQSEIGRTLVALSSLSRKRYFVVSARRERQGWVTEFIDEDFNSASDVKTWLKKQDKWIKKQGNRKLGIKD